MDKAPAPLVLVVEDHPPTRRMIARTLESAGFRARVAGDAREGLGMARREQPALILLDVELPGIHGDAAAAAWKDDPSLHRVPVVLVSAVPDLDGRRGKAGASDALSKPFKPADLVRCARRWARPASATLEESDV